MVVKFSGDDESAVTRRWSDLLICEHLALETVARQLSIEASRTRVIQAGGRTFLEVERFDRHGCFGRSPVAFWASINNAWFGALGMPWAECATRMLGDGLIDRVDQSDMKMLWYFGRMIANSDMHDWNLSFIPLPPRFKLAPCYDMLPMGYAPRQGAVLPEVNLVVQAPPGDDCRQWRDAAWAAAAFWAEAAQDARITHQFRLTCARNADILITALALWR